MGIDLDLYYGILLIMVMSAVIIFFTLYFIPAGYGQLISERWGTAIINNKIGWVIMELPVVFLMAFFWVISKRTFDLTPLFFFVLFNIHYCQRTFIFPLLIRGEDQMPWTIIIFGMIFNTANAFIQGIWIFFLSPDTLYTPEWLLSPQFIIGTIIFLIGFVINIHSDQIIRNLREPGDTEFYIPKGGLFKYVTSANYFGEFTEWVGWAVLTLSLPGLVFAMWTFANLGPRAHSLRKWYRETFGDEFPKERKRMIPFIY
jgi:3-oxo-5-alpha-steroid 4-dehydrogenase 1